MPTANVNILAVIVAAVATLILGAVWYSPVLFAKAWIQAHGYTPEKLEEMKKRGVTRAYAVSGLCYLVMAYVLALLASYTQATSFAQGLWLGFILWLGFAATIGLTAHMFSDNPIAGWGIDAGYPLAYLLLMGGVVAGGEGPTRHPRDGISPRTCPVRPSCPPGPAAPPC